MSNNQRTTHRYYHINPALLASQAAHQQLHHPFLFLPPTAPRPPAGGKKQLQPPVLPSPLANLQELNFFLNEIRDAGACVCATWTAFVHECMHREGWVGTDDLKTKPNPNPTQAPPALPSGSCRASSPPSASWT